MPKVLLCGEGNHDIGHEQWDARSQQKTVQEGWLQGIVRQLLGDEVEFHPVTRKDLPLLPRDQARHRPLPPGHGARALAAVLRAQADKADLVVFMADADTRVVSEWRTTRENILQGFAPRPEVPAVACVPKAASESWLLADQSAWAALGLEDLEMLPSRPEDIWGRRDDPEGNHPHRCFARVCSTAGVPDGTSTRQQLGRICRPEALARSCPVSFKAFQKDLESAQGG